MTPPQSPQSWVDLGDTDCLFYRCPSFFITILGGFRWYRPFYRWPHHSHHNLGWIPVIQTVCSIDAPAFLLQSWVDSGVTDCLFYRCPRFFTTILGGFRWYRPFYRWPHYSHHNLGRIQVIQTVCSIDAHAFSLQYWEVSIVCSINDSTHSPQLWPIATTNTYRNPHVNLARCFTVSHDLGQTQAEVGFPSYWEAFLVSHSDRRLTCFFTSEISSEWRINSNKSVK